MSPIIDQHSIDFISHSAEQTRRLGIRLGELLTGGDVLFFIGNLGSGKTCLIQGVGHGLGIQERITSPTFTLVNEYEGTNLKLYHIDLYRIDNAQATLTFGLDDYLYGDGVCAIEWAERAKLLWTDDYLLIQLRYIDEGKRGCTMSAAGARYDQLIQNFKHSAFGI
ncbi:MAG: tRNA (adenosine(37)-N6)-threonylcarbamoyltransferase complex ATPase subunit type 1 TsaE [Anaerolineae bacterium]|nr:tRNA (adenosine(37)-N6)-threonylcarbamoyltransferase complex ATPase subunit type 1 TsaE [Anaerolineae bacterium]